MIVLGSFGIIGKFCILIVLTFSSLLLQETFCLLLFCLTRKRSVLTISSLLSTSLTPSILCLQCWMLSGTIIKITILRVCWQYFLIFITQSTGIVSLFVPAKTSNHTVCPIKVRIYSAGEYLSIEYTRQGFPKIWPEFEVDNIIQQLIHIRKNTDNHQSKDLNLHLQAQSVLFYLHGGGCICGEVLGSYKT